MTAPTPETVERLAGTIALRAHGHAGKSADAPQPLAAFAFAFARAVRLLFEGTDGSLSRCSLDGIGGACLALARSGLVPGAYGDAAATGYLYVQDWKNALPVGRPNPRGRIAMARAAGLEVETVPVAVGDPVTLDVDGDVVDGTPNPDTRPTKWEHLRGVIVRVEDVRTGAVRRHWVSAGELAERKAKAKPDKNGKLRTWEGDPIAMARSKALSILIDRGTIPQAPIPVPGLREWYATAPAPTLPAVEAPAARALPAPTEPEPADAPPAAPTAPETAPAEPDVSAPAEAEPAATEPPAAAGEGALSDGMLSALLESDAMLALIGDVTAAAFDDRVVSDADAKRSALEAIDAWLIAMAKAGRAPTIEAARAAMPRLIARARDLAGNPPAREV
jgi:hypothetical protein